MANVLNNLSYGDSAVIQFMDDGTLIFRPKHNQTVAGVELAGYLQLDQQTAPAVAPSGSTRLYFDTTLQTLQQSIAGGAFAALAISSLSLGGGSITVSAAGAITATTAAAQALTLNGAASSSVVMSATGQITLTPATGVVSVFNGGLAGTNLSFGALGGLTLNGQSSSSIIISSAGAISLTPASGQLTTVTNFTPVATAAGMTYLLPPLGVTGAGVTLTSVSGANPNVANYWLIYIPTSITVNTIAVNITSANAGSHIGLGLYTYAASQATATKLIDVTLSSAATGIVSAAPTQGATLVPAGWYWLGWTTDSAVAIGTEGYTAYTLATSLAPGKAGSRISVAGATASAAGVLPATTGVLSAGPATQTIPLVLFGQ